MRRFYLAPAPDIATADSLTLTGGEAHHALRVIRVQRGEQVAVLDGAGHRFLCQVSAADRQTVRLTVLERTFIPPLPYQITLLQAITKPKAMDFIVQKAAELGAARIVPLHTQRTVSHLDREQASSKLDKWNAIAIESIKQCGSAWLPQIDPPRDLREFLANPPPFDLAFLGNLDPQIPHLRAFVEDFQNEKKRKPRSVAVWVGPEGDFSPEEMLAIKGSGAKSITLGPLVLRSDTAAIVSLAILSYELQSPDHRDCVRPASARTDE